jgi:TRAP-type C4-dicarboxylate transport system permease small subunit
MPTTPAASITSLTDSGLPFMGILERTEEALLTLLLLAMIVLACLQIVLRSFFSGGLLWADTLIPYLVLWCGMLGAVAAAGQGKHIALDIAANQMPQRIVPYITFLAHVFAACAAAGLSYAAWLFIRDEMLYGGTGPLGLSSWIWGSIFPLAFVLITAKYLLLSLFQLRELLQQQRPAT